MLHKVVHIITTVTVSITPASMLDKIRQINYKTNDEMRVICSGQRIRTVMPCSEQLYSFRLRN